MPSFYTRSMRVIPMLYSQLLVFILLDQRGALKMKKNTSPVWVTMPVCGSTVRSKAGGAQYSTELSTNSKLSSSKLSIYV